MMKAVADNKTSEFILNSVKGNPIDEEIDRTIKELYPDVTDWYLDSDVKFYIREGSILDVLVFKGEKMFLEELKCIYSTKHRKLIFKPAIVVDIAKVNPEAKVTWYDEHKEEIEKLNRNAYDNSSISFLIPFDMMTGTPIDEVMRLLTVMAFAPQKCDTGVVCSTRES